MSNAEKFKRMSRGLDLVQAIADYSEAIRLKPDDAQIFNNRANAYYYDGQLDRAIEEEMKERLGGGRVVRIEEPIYGGSNGALKIAHDMPADFWEKLS